MLCIQCKKMYTVWVQFTKEMEAGMFKTAEAAFVRLRGLLLCEQRRCRGLGCSKQSIRRRPIQPPVCGRPHLRQDE
jgi:hypothetical protein